MEGEELGFSFILGTDWLSLLTNFFTEPSNSAGMVKGEHDHRVGDEKHYYINEWM